VARAAVLACRLEGVAEEGVEAGAQQRGVAEF
jgi:hypothetical protein